MQNLEEKLALFIVLLQVKKATLLTNQNSLSTPQLDPLPLINNYHTSDCLDMLTEY